VREKVGYKRIARWGYYLGAGGEVPWDGAGDRELRCGGAGASGGGAKGGRARRLEASGGFRHGGVLWNWAGLDSSNRAFDFDRGGVGNYLQMAAFIDRGEEVRRWMEAGVQDPRICFSLFFFCIHVSFLTLLGIIIW